MSKLPKWGSKLSRLFDRSVPELERVEEQGPAYTSDPNFQLEWDSRVHGGKANVPQAFVDEVIDLAEKAREKMHELFPDEVRTRLPNSGLSILATATALIIKQDRDNRSFNPALDKKNIEELLEIAFENGDIAADEELKAMLRKLARKSVELDEKLIYPNQDMRLRGTTVSGAGLHHRELSPLDTYRGGIIYLAGDADPNNVTTHIDHVVGYKNILTRNGPTRLIHEFMRDEDFERFAIDVGDERPVTIIDTAAAVHGAFVPDGSHRQAVFFEHLAL